MVQLINKKMAKIISEMKKTMSWSEIVEIIKKEHDIDIKKGALKTAVWRHFNDRPDRKSGKKYKSVKKRFDALSDFGNSINESVNLVKEADINFELTENRYVGLVFTSDWHIGAEGASHDQLVIDMHNLSREKNLIKICVGDYTDNYIEDSPKGGKATNICKPSHQRLLARELISLLKPHVLLLGCHGDWSVREDDNNFVAEWCDQMGIIYMGYGGKINITIGNITYVAYVRHKYNRNSNITPQTSLNAMYAEHGFDIGVQAHFHYPFYCTQNKTAKQQRVHMCKCGSYKIKDRYGDKIGGYTGQIGNPFFILDSQTKEITFVDWDIEKGLKYLSVLNGG